MFLLIFHHQQTEVLTFFGEDLAALLSVEETEQDFILANSAIKAGASVLTTADRSDSSVRDWTAKG